MSQVTTTGAATFDDITPWRQRYEKGFQAGLKRGAEIAAKTQHQAQRLREAGHRIKGSMVTEEHMSRIIEQAILKELSEDCSPSVSPED